MHRRTTSEGGLTSLCAAANCASSVSGCTRMPSEDATTFMVPPGNSASGGRGRSP